MPPNLNQQVNVHISVNARLVPKKVALKNISDTVIVLDQITRIMQKGNSIQAKTSISTLCVTDERGYETANLLAKCWLIQSHANSLAKFILSTVSTLSVSQNDILMRKAATHIVQIMSAKDLVHVQEKEEEKETNLIQLPGTKKKGGEEG